MATIQVTDTDDFTAGELTNGDSGSLPYKLSDDAYMVIEAAEINGLINTPIRVTFDAHRTYVDCTPITGGPFNPTRVLPVTQPDMVFTAVLYDPDIRPANLTGATIALRIAGPGRTLRPVSATATILNATAGQILVNIDGLVPGLTYHARFAVTIGSAVRSYPTEALTLIFR